jgi:hypothetical protein
MHPYRIFSVVALAGRLAAFDTPEAAGPGGAGSDRMDVAAVAMSRPPVLRSSEPQDSVTLRLPGVIAKPVAVRPAPSSAAPRIVVPPQPKADPALTFPVPAPEPRLQALALAPLPPVSVVETRPEPAKRELPKSLPKPVLPSELQRDSALFCQRRIFEWGPPDAYNLLGDPVRERAAYDDDRKPNGKILAYPDPTGRYRELELDFDAETGLLRSVFVYPWKMNWQDCRRLWGANVTSATASKGRTFHSYLNRRLDVLVDGSGRVVSLGLY